MDEKSDFSSILTSSDENIQSSCLSTDALSSNLINCSDYETSTSSIEKFIENIPCQEINKESNYNTSQYKFFSDMTNLMNQPITSYEDAIKSIKNLKQNYTKNSRLDFQIQSDFLNTFNDYFGIIVTSLRDAKNYLQFSKKQEKQNNEKEVIKNDSKESEKPDEISQDETIIGLKARIHELEHQIFQLKAQNSTANDIHNDTEYQLSFACSRNQGLEQNIGIAQAARLRYETAMQDMIKLVESQQEDITKLSKQREKLIILLQKLLYTKEKEINLPKQDKIKPIKEEIPKEKPQNNNSIDESQYILNLIDKTIARSSIQDSIVNQVHDIATDPRYSPDTLINNIISYICQKYNELESSTKSFDQEKNELNDKIRIADYKSIKTLRLFEEELKFMQKISRNEKYQDLLLSNASKQTPLHMDTEAQEELARRCMKISKYIEDTIGEYPQEEITHALSLFDGLDSKLVFELQKTCIIENRLSLIHSTINNGGEIDTNMLYSILLAQVFINDLLCNNSMDMENRIAYLMNELKKTAANQQNNQIENNKSPLLHSKQTQKDENPKSEEKQKEKEKQKINKRELSLIEIINILLPSDEEFHSIKQLRAAAKNHKQLISDTLTTLSKENKKLKRICKAQNKEIDSKQKELERMNEEINQKNNEKEESVKTNNEKLSLKEKETQELNEKITEYKNKIDEYEKELESLNSTIKEKDEEIDKIKQEQEAITQELNQKQNEINDFIQNNEKQRQEDENLISNLQDINRNNQETIEKLRETTEELKRKHESLHETAQQIRNERDQLQIKIREKDDILRACKTEIDSLNLCKKTQEIKIKTLEEKLFNEKKTIEAQMKAKITAIESISANEKNVVTEKYQQVFSMLSHFFNPILENEDINNYCRRVQKELNSLIQFVNKYKDDIDDMERCKCIMNCFGHKTLSIALEDLIAEKEKTVTVEKIVYKNDPRVFQEAQKSRKWQLWADRLLHSYSNQYPSNMSPDQMRRSIEEIALLAANRRLFNQKLNTLKTEKIILANHNKDLLYQRSTPKSDWKVILPTVLACSKLLKMVGV